MPVTVHHLPTGTYETRAALAVRGGSWREKRAFAASAVLVRHPAGDLLIDAGFGAGLEQHLAMLPRYRRSPHVRGRTVAEQLDAAGYDRGRLLGVVPTHTHWDHVSGLDGLAGTPVWLNEAERAYAAKEPVFRSVAGEIHSYPVSFSSRHDVHGDGSVVIALAGGHTPGSVIVFVEADRRYAFIGDLTWQLDGIRPWLMRKLADDDPALVRAGLRRLAALDDVHVVPAHDLRAYDGIPLLAPGQA